MKKLFTTCAILAAASLIVISCKKSTVANTVVAATSTTGTVTPAAAVFEAMNVYGDNGTSGSNDSSAAATVAVISSVNIGTVTISSDTVGNLAPGDYSTAISLNTILPFPAKPIWKITGANGFGAFTYACVKGMPNVGNLHLSQTSFSKSANLVLTHSAITADSVTYTIDDAFSHQVKKTVAGSSSGCTFTAAMLSSLTVSNGIQNGSISIVGQTEENSTQGGKNIYFFNSSGYTKNVTINN